jgi:hypothetical protein
LGLAALLGYNVLSFLLHGPFGDSKYLERVYYLLHPDQGWNAAAAALLHHITSVAGADALPNRIADPHKLDDWLTSQTGGTQSQEWYQSDDSRRRGKMALWNSLHWRTKWQLRFAALRHRRSKLLLLQDAWDGWIPLLVGLASFIAATIALVRLA